MKMMRCCRRMPAVLQPVRLAHACPVPHANTTSRFPSKIAPVLAPRQSSRQVAARAWGDDVEFTPATVLSSTKAAATMHLVTIDVGADIAAGYKTGGQYMQLKVGDSKPAFMAIANAPSKVDGKMEFLIKYVPDSTAAEIIALGEGDKISVSPVMGKGFPVDKVPADKVETMLIFATGSGISPIKALIEAGALDAASRKKTTLYYGTTDIDSMAFAERIPAWEEQGVEVVKVFSKRGEGYVQDVYAKGEPLEDASKACVLLCGQKDMAESVKAILGKQGMPEERFLTNF